MNIQTVSPNSFVVYITSEELAERGISPLEIDGETALSMLSPILGDRSFMRADAFPGRDGVLIFLRKCTGPVRFFVFEDFESLLDAVTACGEAVLSSLHFENGRYILSVRDADGAQFLPLREFADELDFPEEYALYLSEHGKLLISHNAAALLASVFDR